jgi:hypothetical protein
VRLKSCPNPWCEALDYGNDFPPVTRRGNFNTHFVACTSCSQRGPVRQSESEAIAEWNARPTDDVVSALKIAKRHLEHQSAWIGQKNMGYSFESLGEDMPIITAALAKAGGSL